MPSLVRGVMRMVMAVKAALTTRLDCLEPCCNCNIGRWDTPTISGIISGAWTQIVFATENYRGNVCTSAWDFTADRAGYYRVTTFLYADIINLKVAVNASIALFKNNDLSSILDVSENASATFLRFHGNDVIWLGKDDSCKLQLTMSGGSPVTAPDIKNLTGFVTLEYIGDCATVESEPYMEYLP